MEHQRKTSILKNNTNLSIICDIRKTLCNRVSLGILGLLFFFLSVTTNLFSTEKPKVALVLSGGGAKGFAHIGMLKLIDEMNIKVDYIVGTSMGAVIGGMYASGLSALEIEEIVVNLNWNNLLNDKVSRYDLHTGQKKWLPTGNYYFGLNERNLPVLPKGLIIANNIHLQLFYETWHVAHLYDFTDLYIPFVCIATDIETGEMVLFDRGSLADVMRASVSMPSFFEPIEINNRLLVDGGVSQNFPADIARELGSDFVIGLKTSTEMFKRNELNSPIRIINQTLNIAMQYKQNMAEKQADIIISPNTDEFSIMDFHLAENIIKVGYIEALRYYDELRDFESLLKEYEQNDSVLCQEESQNPQTTRQKTTAFFKLPNLIKFDSILIQNNEYLTSQAVRDYLGLYVDTYYDRDDVHNAFKKAFSTELFDKIYPNIVYDKGKYDLVVIVKEKERKNVGVNLIYNQYDSLVTGVIIDFRNVLFRNSNLLVNFQLGGRSAFEIDYTKTFNRKLSTYYRIFPYIKEEVLYEYDDDFHRVKSFNHFETGFTAGVGTHAIKNTFFEPFIYFYRLEFTRKVSETELFDRTFYSSGIGVKLYYENIDDFPFYKKGSRFVSKYILSGTNDLSEKGYQKLMSSLSIARPIDRNLSLIAGIEYGTYFMSEPVPQDPFFIGGLNSFIGLYPKEVSAPFYRLSNFGFRINPYQNFFLDLITNVVTFGSIDSWLLMDETVLGIGAIAGYNTLLGPARIGIGVNQNSRTFVYLSIGFDHDAFFFSRR